MSEDIEALKRDADRYRWLRRQHWSESNFAVVRNPKQAVKLGHDLPSLERLDEFIDEEMKQESFFNEIIELELS